MLESYMNNRFMNMLIKTHALVIKETNFITPNTILFHKQQNQFYIVRQYNGSDYTVERLHENLDKSASPEIFIAKANEVADISAFHFCNTTIIKNSDEETTYKRIVISRIMLEKSRTILVNNSILTPGTKLLDNEDRVLVLSSSPYIDFKNRDNKARVLKHFKVDFRLIKQFSFIPFKGNTSLPLTFMTYS